MGKILKNKELDYTILEFHKNYVISRVKEDIIFDKNHLVELRKICLDFYGLKKFVYISLRKHSYNVNPIVYFHLKKVTSLAGIAIVSNDNAVLHTANFEGNFSPVPFDIFESLEEAISWSNSTVEDLEEEK